MLQNLFLKTVLPFYLGPVIFYIDNTKIPHQEKLKVQVISGSFTETGFVAISHIRFLGTKSSCLFFFVLPLKLRKKQNSKVEYLKYQNSRNFQYCPDLTINENRLIYKTFSCHSVFWDDITKFWDENLLIFTFLTGKLRKKTCFGPIRSSPKYHN